MADKASSLKLTLNNQIYQYQKENHCYELILEIDPKNPATLVAQP